MASYQNFSCAALPSRAASGRSQISGEGEPGRGRTHVPAKRHVPFPSRLPLLMPLKSRQPGFSARPVKCRDRALAVAPVVWGGLWCLWWCSQHFRRSWEAQTPPHRQKKPQRNRHGTREPPWNQGNRPEIINNSATRWRRFLPQTDLQSTQCGDFSPTDPVFRGIIC